MTTLCRTSIVLFAVCLLCPGLSAEAPPPAAGAPTSRPGGRAPVRIIFDTDLDSDCDDLGALAVLHALADLGEAEILAVVTTTDDAWSPRCADAVNTYYGRPDVPIGVLDPNRGARGGRSRYTRAVAEACPHDLRAYEAAEDAVALYRRTLASQPDRSVVVVTVAHLTSLARLMKSPPDKHSPLSGLELVAKKVRLWSCMGGSYPKGKEPNFYRPDPASTVHAVGHWPAGVRVVFSGAEIGKPIQTGARLRETPAGNPVRIGYESYFRAPGRSRSSWDQTAVLYAVRGLGDRWATETTGHCHVFPDGSNEWRPSPDKAQEYLKPKLPPNALAALIESLMLRPPRQPAAPGSRPTSGSMSTPSAAPSRRPCSVSTCPGTKPEGLDNGSGTRSQTRAGHGDGCSVGRTEELVAYRGQARRGIPPLRLPALPGNLHAPGMGRKVHPPTGVPALRQAHHSVGTPNRGLIQGPSGRTSSFAGFAKVFVVVNRGVGPSGPIGSGSGDPSPSATSDIPPTWLIRRSTRS